MSLFSIWLKFFISAKKTSEISIIPLYIVRLDEIIEAAVKLPAMVRNRIFENESNGLLSVPMFDRVAFSIVTFLQLSNINRLATVDPVMSILFAIISFI